MNKLIRLAYCKRIDASATKPWERAVVDDTYLEFFMQAPLYNPQAQYETFQELLDNVPNAEGLHNIVSRAAVGYLRQLNNRIPDVVNALGALCLPFDQFKFEIVASHVSQKKAHRIAIYFYSDPLTWIDTVGGQLVVAYGDQRAALQAGEPVQTDLIALQPNLSIWTYQATGPLPIP